jgi:PAS domain S-box-containing protein
VTERRSTPIDSRASDPAPVGHREEPFHFLVESSFDLISILDPSGTYRYANPAHEMLLGLRAERLAGQNMDAFVHPADVALLRGQLSEAATHAGRAVTVTYRLRHRDGSWHQIEGIARDHADDPAVSGVLVIGHDMSWRTREAELLRTLNVRLGVLRGIDRAILVQEPASAMVAEVLEGLQQVTDSALAIALMWDVDANVARVVAGGIAGESDVAIGNAFPLHEFSPVSTFLENPTIYVPDLDTLASPSPIVARARMAGMRSLLTESMVSHGEFFGVLTLCSRELDAYDADNLALARDVTNQVALALLQARLRDQLQAQAQLLETRVRERTAQLEAANHDLEMFSHSVSHDLRSPLQTIGGFSGLLREELEGSQSPVVTECLDHIRDGVRTMDDMINALLRLARVSRARLQWEEVDLSMLAEKAVENLRARSPDRAVEIEIARDLVASGDRDLLSLVFANLLSNAWKYTSRRSDGRIEVGVATRSNRREYFVRDNGAGFDMEYAASLFAPFQRLHRKEDYEGTGLGLATVRQIVRRHGGDVRAEAAVDKGATFYFTLGETAAG